MDKTRRHQVSLRGASAKEITRDALLEKVSQERELRNFTRRATAAAHFIQRVWRGYSATKKIALHFQLEWETMVKCRVVPVTRSWISTDFLRPFLFFITRLSTRKQRFQDRDIECMLNCFRVLLDSINSTDTQRNFCALATCTIEERRIWNYQAKKLISLSLLILSECDYSPDKHQDLIILTSIAMRFVVILIDVKMWKIATDKVLQDSDIAVKDIVQYMGGKKSGLYVCIRKYISRLDAPFTSQVHNSTRTDDKFLITASAVTLALRPFRIANSGLDVKDDNASVHDAAEQYCVFLLTIPWFAQRLPPMILSALKHESVLSPCFRTLLVSKETIMKEMSDPYNLNTSISQVGWTLANIIYLSTDSLDLGKFTQALDYSLYLRVVNILAENLVSSFEKSGAVKESETHASLKMSYMDFFKPLCQQGHLMKLLTFEKQYELLDVAYYYSHMLKIYSVLNPTVGSLPVLNMLSFTPGFLLNLWESLVKSIFNGRLQIEEDEVKKLSDRKKAEVFEMKQKQVVTDTSSRWTNVLNKITGISKPGLDKTDSVKYMTVPGEIDEDSSEIWDIDPLRRGPDGISRDTSCLLNLFCATYSHLLLVLDDTEFYDKQVPFKLAQQRKTASMLNTLVCNGLCYGVGEQHRSLMDSAIRCLHLLYERDCRHQYCPPELWLSPARKNRPPIAVAARTHEAMSSAVRSDDSSSMRSVITTIPHVFPFEERVQMFREFINMDKVSRRMAGELMGPGPQAIEVVIRRNHIVEDGFEQLNSLGSRLKSGIHVSFVSECGLPEAGLDYGGLSKEFLTDIAKAAFTPEYGLFSQTSTTERLIMPNTSARFLENGIQMIEFLGRIVGKALYEGILLDYSFSHAFVQKLLGRYSFLDELSALDPELYKSLMCVKHYDGDVMDLCLDFTVTEESFGKMHIIELIPGGKNVSVNNENKLLYLHAMADFKLNRQVLPFSSAFYRGLTDVVSPSWLKLFNASEFNQLLSGGNHDIDVDDLRNNTRYTGGYSEGSRTIKLFWEVISGFEPNERCLLLKFVTSCSRAPLLGFKHLQPTFTIHKVACDVPLWATFGGQDVERLPSAGTCYNTLKLPSYKRSSTLRAKLLYAIKSNAGFELS